MINRLIFGVAQVTSVYTLPTLQSQNFIAEFLKNVNQL